MLLKTLLLLPLATFSTYFVVKVGRWRVDSAKFFTGMLDTFEYEERMLGNILSDPYKFYWYSLLEADYFSSKVLQSAWPEILSYFRAKAWYPDEQGFSTFAEAKTWLDTIRARESIDKSEVTSIIKGRATELKASLPALISDDDLSNNEINEFLSNSLVNKKDKHILATVIKEENSESFTFTRLLKNYPKSLYFLTFIVTYLGLFGFTSLVDLRFDSLSTPAKITIYLTLYLLMLSSLIWAVVDLYTMFLDYEFFKLTTFITSTIFTLSIFLLSDDFNSALNSLGRATFVPLLILIFMKLLLFIFKKVKNVDGMGLGDFYIIVPVTLIPLYYTQSLSFAFQSFMLSNILGIVGWLTLRVQGKISGRNDPFPFGPYLAVGWLVALFLFTSL